MAPLTEFARDFCAGIGPLQLGVVLVNLFFSSVNRLAMAIFYFLDFEKKTMLKKNRSFYKSRPCFKLLNSAWPWNRQFMAVRLMQILEDLDGFFLKICDCQIRAGFEFLSEITESFNITRISKIASFFTSAQFY